MKTRIGKILIVCVFLSSIALATVLLLNREKSAFDIDVSDIDLELTVKRLDQDLFSDYENVELHVDSLEKKYGEFFMLYTKQIIRIGHSGDQTFYKYLSAFLSDFTVLQAKDAVQEKYPSVIELEATLEDAFRHVKYYYPTVEVPEIVTFIAGFNHSIVTTENWIGIGLDKYLGADSEFYEMMRIPKYASQNMKKEMIPVDCMTAWFNMEFPDADTTDYLISKMIHEGKRMYFLDVVFPELSDAVKMGYSDSELAYCDHFETEMWSYYVSEKLLYSSDYLQQRKFLGEAPFTSAFGNESPGRAAIWTGWQIVRSFAKENNLSPLEVLEETDYQKILHESYYDPK